LALLRLCSSGAQCTLIFKNVPAAICDNCTKYYLSAKVMQKRLQRAEAAIQGGAELEIMRLR
jgi:hypothetical protein